MVKSKRVQQQNFTKISGKHRGTGFKPHEMGTDTADRGTSKHAGIRHELPCHGEVYRKSRMQEICASQCDKHVGNRYKLSYYGSRYILHIDRGQKMREPSMNLRVTHTGTKDHVVQGYSNFFFSGNTSEPQKVPGSLPIPLPFCCQPIILGSKGI